MYDKDQELLEKFICDENLKKLEKTFGQFNIFDCLKLTRAEIRHSNFLAWLLNPNETHGLKDKFLKDFLIKILGKCKKELSEIDGKDLILKNSNNEDVKENYIIPSIIDIDCWDMSEAVVYRELEDIDVLLVDEINKFVLVIENKIGTSQHDNQLTKYRNYVDTHYSSNIYKKIFIYLKPQKESVERPYIYLDYQVINVLIRKLLDEFECKINKDVVTLIKHYNDILERKIMKEKNIGSLCAKIYRQHKEAIDLINKYGTPQKELGEILLNVLEEKDYFQDIEKSSDINYFCLPKLINNNEELSFEKKKIAHFKFVNFRGNYDQLWLEIFFPKTTKIEDCQKQKLIIENLEKNNIKINRGNDNSAWSDPITLIKLDEYLDCNRQEIKTMLSNRIENLKQNGFIDKFLDALNII